MQLSSTQSKLLWLVLPALALATTPPVSASTTVGTGPLNLVTPQDEAFPNRVAYCKHDDYPDHFVSSLNYTFPDTPAIPQSFLISAGLSPDEGDYPFDCFVELPGGVVVFEVCPVLSLRNRSPKLFRMRAKSLKPSLQIKGDIDSHLKLAFEVWLSVLTINYQIGVYSCDLLDLEQQPCSFNIDKYYFKGQGGLFPEPDKDPDYVDLCLEVYGTVKIPYTRITKNINFKKCFTRIPKDGEPLKIS